MKIRSGFVSNSSSSSFIVITSITSGDYIHKLRKKFEGQSLVIDKDFGETEFGWQFEKYSDFGSKIIFAYLQAAYMTIYRKDTDSGQQWLNMLEKVIKDKLKISEIVWNISAEYDSPEGKDHAYIDHQSASYEGKNTDMFDDENSLTNFLFNPQSYIETGNDNV